jgi:MFS family permease
MGAARSAAVRGWAVAGGVYFLAVFNRSSLGVAGLTAERRFGIGPGALSVFVLLQIGVYAAMQIPTGVLVDRYGPRRLLFVAATLLGLAQLGFALADSYPLALLARALLGCGDALTFVSVLRFTAGHFSARRYPLMVALTATLGTLGNVLATAPLAALLSGAGWTTSFVIAAIASAAFALAVLVLVDDRTPRPRAVRRSEVSAGLRTVTRRVRAAWSIGGTRLGFWVHFSSMAAATPLAVLWGQPYLVEGAGFSTAGAARVLLVAVLVIGLATPAIGAVTGRWPVTRIPLSLVVCAVTIALMCTVSLGLSDHPAKPIVAVVFVIALLGGPASMTAFAVARDYNPARTLGTASGVVNVGGFSATVIAAVAFGAVLDIQGGSNPSAMRHALLVLVGVQVCGSWRLGVWYRRVRGEVRRRQLAGEEVPVRVGRTLWFDVRELEGPAVESVG